MRLEQQPRGREVIFDSKTGKQQPDPGRVTHGVSLQAMHPEVLNLVAEAYIQVAEPEMHGHIEWFVYPSVLRYSAGGLYKTHADSEMFDPVTGLWTRVIDRDVSLLIYLNNDFTGGNITFPKFNFTYRPEVGDLLIFPSDHRYMHRAEVVYSGFRYAVVSWAHQQGKVRVQAELPGNTVFLHQK